MLYEEITRYGRGWFRAKCEKCPWVGPMASEEWAEHLGDAHLLHCKNSIVTRDVHVSTTSVDK